MGAKWRRPKVWKKCRDGSLRRGLLFLLLFEQLLRLSGAEPEPKFTTDPARSARLAAEPQSASGLFSIGYSLGNSPQLVANAIAECVPGYRGVVLGGVVKYQGDQGTTRWLAHVDTPGHIHWAVRVSDENRSSSSSMTCRQNMIFSQINTGPNRGCLGVFEAESLKPVKIVQFTASLLNQMVVELHDEETLPLAVSILQDGGDRVALTIVSQDFEITLNKIYSIPAFASTSKDPYGRVSRCGAFRAQDGSGYYLVITDVERSTGGEKKRLGIIRTGLDGTLKWTRLYAFNLGGGVPLGTKVASDSAILAATTFGSSTDKSMLIKIAPDGSEAWAKIFNAPNVTFFDFHGDSTPFRFIEPNIKAVGVATVRGGLQTILFALDYGTGAILHQTRFPASFNGGGAFSTQDESGIYVSTYGAKWGRGGLKGIASMCRFDHQLQLVAAKEIVGAQVSFPLVSKGPGGTNMLSYEFTQPFRGVGSAVNDNLEPGDVPCSWIRELNLSMEHCSYSSTDAEFAEEQFAVETTNGKAAIEPGAFKLVPLDLKLESGSDHAIQSLPLQPGSAPAGKSSNSPVQRDPIRALADPKPVGYRTSSEIAAQSDPAQFSDDDAAKPKAENIRQDPRYAPLDARLNKAYLALRLNLSGSKKENLKRFEKAFLSRRDQLQGDPDAFFALTEKQIGILEKMSGGVATGAELPLEKNSQ